MTEQLEKKSEPEFCLENMTELPEKRIKLNLCSEEHDWSTRENTELELYSLF